MKCVAIEEAFICDEIADAYLSMPPEVLATDRDVLQMKLMMANVPRLRGLLTDVGEGRLAMMDEAGVDVALLSLMAPGVQSFGAQQGAELATLANDRLAEAIRRHPQRLGGLAAFAPQDPDTAAAEIERAVSALGLQGVLVNSHTQGRYLDDPRFTPVLEAIESLGVPLYIHPRNPPADMVRYLESAGPAFEGAHPGVLHERGGPRITEAFWGFHMETSLHVARMIVSGVFERFPGLTVILGHLGEGLPGVLERMDWAGRLGFALPRPASETFRRNIYLTTSGMMDHHIGHATLRFCAEVMGHERILFAADHPFGNMKGTREAVQAAGLTDEAQHAIFHGNAERVFGLGAG